MRAVRASLRVCRSMRHSSSGADDWWRLSGECGRWAAESHDNATRDAFRHMAKVWAQLAFSLNFTSPTRNEPVDAQVIEGSGVSKNVTSEKSPILTEASDSHAEKKDTPQERRVSLPARTPFPER